MKKKYKYPATKYLKNKLKPYWKKLEALEDDFRNKLQKLEKKMEKETGMPTIEFFWCDNSIIGIGNAERTMELIHREYEFLHKKH